MDPICFKCEGTGRRRYRESGLETCQSCGGTGRYGSTNWKSTRFMDPDDWPGMRPGILYAASERIAPELAHLDWAEFGVWRGNSARFLLKLLPPMNALHLYDSFEGLPENWEAEQNQPEGVLSLGGEIPVFNDPRAIIHKGWFKDTLKPGTSYSFVFMDCDLYTSAKTVLTNLNLRKGTIIVFDEYRGGESKALEEMKIPFEILYETWYETPGFNQVAVQIQGNT